MKKETMASIGAMAAALLAATCCIGPVLFVLFGASFAFLGKLRRFTLTSSGWLESWSVTLSEALPEEARLRLPGGRTHEAHFPHYILGRPVGGPAGGFFQDNHTVAL